jgi:isocitrate lyase
MTQQAPNQEVLYISGWACSSVLTTTNEVSADFGDYPYNTVPNQVQRLFKAQQLHDRKNWDNRRKMTPEERAKTPYLDYMRPIIADGDTGYVWCQHIEPPKSTDMCDQSWGPFCRHQAGQALR